MADKFRGSGCWRYQGELNFVLEIIEDCIRDQNLAEDWFQFTAAQYIRCVVVDLVFEMVAIAPDDNEAWRITQFYMLDKSMDPSMSLLDMYSFKFPIQNQEN